MLHAERVTLRAIRREDLDLLHPAFAGDPAAHAVVDGEAWRPTTLTHALAEFDRRDVGPADPAAVAFAVQRRDDPQGTCIGSCSLWGIDLHQRTTHLGISLLPAARGAGLGRETVDLLCRYAFDERDLARVQLETLASNQAMQRTALACGFVEEGRLRESAWVQGARQDELIFGLLAAQWRSRRPARTRPGQTKGAQGKDSQRKGGPGG